MGCRLRPVTGLMRRMIVGVVAAVTVTFAGAPQALAADATFGSASFWGNSVFSHTLAVADLNNDSVPDTVVLDGIVPQLTAYLGQGDGTFGSAIDRSMIVGGQYVGLVLGDVNGDGLSDAMVGDAINQEIYIFPGNGNGTFGFAVTVSAFGAPQALALGDLDRDGDLDLLVSFFGGSIGRLLNPGNGVFANEQVIATPDTANQIAVSDINGDGYLDVATPNSFDASVSVLYNNGSGTLSPQTRILLTPVNSNITTAQGLAIGDFDHDGLGELAVNVNGNSGAAGLLVVNPRTSAITMYTYNATPGLVSVADMNLDGYLDVLAGYFYADDVVIWYGQASGGLAPTGQVLDLGSGNAAYLPVPADLQGNGVPDLVIGLQSAQFAVVMNLVSPPHAAGAPPDWMQQMGRSEVEACPAGWNPSWAQWPNEGTGGFVCTRTLRWTPTRWVAV